MSIPKLISLLVLVACCGLSGCAREQSGTDAAIESLSRQFVPRDELLAATYNRSCRNCHTIAATGAPLTGDTGAWSDLLDKGIDTLVDNVVNGFGGMPPFGMCMECDVEDFEALIDFMSRAENPSGTVDD